VNVAVIGAGVFGCLSSLELAKFGHNVTLFEKDNIILNGATAKSQNRLHLGLHYPRDLETALQSVSGFATFKAEFPEAINLGFDNYYAIAKEGSRVSTTEFEEFAFAAGIQITPNSEGFYLPNGLKIKNVNQVWKCNEGVIDMLILAEILNQLITESSVDLRLNSEVSHLRKVGDNWILNTNHAEDVYDYVIRCTYSSDRIEVHSTNYSPKARIYHKTLIQVIESDVNNFGITIVDGDFLTILPKGFSQELLAYGPSISTKRVLEAQSLPTDWIELSDADVSTFQVEIYERINEWIEGWNFSITNKVLETTRTIEVGVESTDRRTSQVLISRDGMIDIWSGKIDHAVEISRKLPGLIANF
jgi:FAD dependent oxidoreductase